MSDTMKYNFSQNDFTKYLCDVKVDPQKLREAEKIINRYDGLCDIICNHITSQDILGDSEKMENYKEKSNLESLLDGQYTQSHILNINSITRFFQLILCIVFKYYPESPLN